MRSPRVLVHEKDGRLAVLLENSSETAAFLRKARTEEPAPTHNWSLRQPRGLETCLRLLHGGPAILIVNVAGKLGPTATVEDREAEQRRRERAFHLLERAACLRPEAAVIAVSDVADDALAALAWELGATYVLFPPQPSQLLLGVVAHLMQKQGVRS